MCYYSDRDYAKKIRGRFREEDISRISQLFFRKTVQLVIGCGSEPTLYKNYVEIIEKASNAGIPYIGLTTNGQLVSDNDIEKMVVAKLSEITISTHGVHQSTYETFMVNAKYDRLLNLLRSLDQIKKQHGVSYPDLRINYTVNKDNLDELNNFFNVYGQFGIKTLQLRPMVDVGNTEYLHHQMDEACLNSYYQIIQTLEKECRDRGITFLATRKDPNFSSFDKSTSYILPAVLRTIHPNKVWMIDFNWRSETYREYCRRIKWRLTLLQTVLGQKEFFKQTKHYLSYDIDL